MKQITSLDGLSVEDIIRNEDNIDWESASFQTTRNLTLVEVRLFRSKINWNLYVLRHKMTTECLECASKYFAKETYNRIAAFNFATEEFIVNHKDDFNWSVVIANCKLSEETLLNCVDSWVHRPHYDLMRIFKEAREFDIFAGGYEQVRLLVELV